MKKSFKNKDQVEVIFTDEGVTFYGAEQEVYFPYGCIDEIRMSLLGILQCNHLANVCSFAVDHKDRKEMKEMIQFAREAMKTAPEGELQIFDNTKKDASEQVSGDLSPEEQLKKYKEQFIQGIISKEEYDLHKRQLKK